MAAVRLVVGRIELRKYPTGRDGEPAIVAATETNTIGWIERI